MDTSALFKISYGLYVLCTRVGEKLNGCIVNTVTQVTNDPVVVAVAVNKANRTADMICESREFTVSMRNIETSFELIKHFGFASGREVDKFQGFPHQLAGEDRLPYLEEACSAYLLCRVIEVKDLGTHLMFFAEVVESKTLSDTPALTYDYYQQHIKPRPGAKATPPRPERWVCDVCGYVHEGPLPKDFICPLCGVAAGHFHREQESAPVAAPKGKTVKRWVCRVCGYVYEGGDVLPPDYICPLCKHGAEAFDYIDVEVD